MVLGNGGNDSNVIPEPSVNVQVFGEGSIGDAFGGFLSSVVGGFTSLMRKLVDAETSMKAMVNLVAFLIIVVTLIIAYRQIGKVK